MIAYVPSIENLITEIM